MSRRLPARPSLEHLRKQARELLEELRRKDSALRLSDAQHALAREYGFASWPKLKAHVDLQAVEQTSRTRPLAGQWRANLAKSKRHPANEFQTATIVFEVRGDDIRITDVVIDASGREKRHINVIRADGVEHASEPGDGYSLLAKWRDLQTLETVGKKDGQLVGAATYEVSVDGQTLTISADQQLIVFDRVTAEAAL